MYLNFAARDGINLSFCLLMPAGHLGIIHASFCLDELGFGVVLWWRVAVWALAPGLQFLFCCWMNVGLNLRAWYRVGVDRAFGDNSRFILSR